MRKFTLILSLCVFAFSGFAQRAATKVDNKFTFELPQSAKGEADITDTLVPASFLTGTPTVYTVAPAGYASGANKYGDKGKAQHFNSGTETYLIQGVQLWIYEQSITEDSLKFVVYNFDGEPTTELSSMKVAFSQVTTTVEQVSGTTDFWYSVIFDAPVEVTGDFAVGVEFEGLTSGFGLVSTSEGDGGKDAWELWGDGTGWYSFLDANSWGLDVDMGIFPMISIKAPHVPVALPIDFETPVTFNSWSSVTTIIPNPNSGGINTSANVAQHVKEAGNAWAGVIIELDDFIDFSVNTEFSMKVFSPAANTPVLFKLEADGVPAKEVMGKTTKANEWETLTFDFTGTTSDVFKKLVLFFNAGVDGAGTYLFDDIYLLPGSGVNEMNLNAISITPNPFSSELIINNAEGASKIIVSNLLGQAILTVDEIANTQTISTEGLKNGIYIVTIIDKNNNRRSERVIKQ